MIYLLFFIIMADVDFNSRRVADEIPASMRGAWDETAAACDDEYSISRVHIGSNWVAFYESEGILQYSTPAGIANFDNAVALRFVMGGEGSTWINSFVLAQNEQASDRLTLFEVKDLSNLEQERRSETWVRCGQ